MPRSGSRTQQSLVLGHESCSFGGISPSHTCNNDLFPQTSVLLIGHFLPEPSLYFKKSVAIKIHSLNQHPTSEDIYNTYFWFGVQMHCFPSGKKIEKQLV